MSIGKNNPFLTVNVLILDALVDGVQRPSENGISDVMGIIGKEITSESLPDMLAAIA